MKPYAIYGRNHAGRLTYTIAQEFLNLDTLEYYQTFSHPIEAGASDTTYKKYFHCPEWV